VVPNVLAGDGITISNVEVKFDFWSRGGVSALGLGGQGGGGGATTLDELDDVTITSPANGQALVYNNGSWVNAVVTPDLSNYATKQWVQDQGYLTSLPAHNHDGRYYISNGTIHLGNQSITPHTSSALDGYVPKSGTTWWGQSLNSNGEVKGVLNYVTSIEFTEAATGTGGYLDFHYNGDTGDFTSRIIEDASGRIAINNTAFFHKNATPGSDLRVAMTDWQSVNFQTQITNNVAFHSNIYVRGNIHLRNGGGIDMLDNVGGEKNVLTFNTHNDLAIGYGARLAGYSTYIQGSPIHFNVGTSASGIVAATIDTNGQLYIRQATQGIRIGDGLITWDSQYNAIKVSLYDGSAANFVALGGVSALGIGGAGGTDSATISQLTSDNIYVSTSVNDQDDLWYINADGFHHDGNIDCNHMTAARFYVGNNRYKHRILGREPAHRFSSEHAAALKAFCVLNLHIEKIGQDFHLTAMSYSLDRDEMNRLVELFEKNILEALCGPEGGQM
jgi:hypothetical protein